MKMCLVPNMHMKCRAEEKAPKLATSTGEGWLTALAPLVLTFLI